MTNNVNVLNMHMVLLVPLRSTYSHCSSIISGNFVFLKLFKINLFSTLVAWINKLIMPWLCYYNASLKTVMSSRRSIHWLDKKKIKYSRCSSRRIQTWRCSWFQAQEKKKRIRRRTFCRTYTSSQITVGLVRSKWTNAINKHHIK